MQLHHHKIVFCGPMGAGKSAAIQALSDIAVLSTEAKNTDQAAHLKQLTTVGIDYGEIQLDAQTKIGLYGTPGQDRFSFIWPVVSKGAIGIVMLLDHSGLDPLGDLALYLDAFATPGANIVIGVTHMDLKPLLTLAMYQQWLEEKNHPYPVFAIDARQREDVLLAIEALMTIVEVDQRIQSRQALLG